jgi:hypothetical protein
MVSLLESICMESHLKQIAGESICGMKSLAGNDLIIIDTVFFSCFFSILIFFM